MKLSLFDAPAHEPSRFVGFAGNEIDRQAEHRSDDALEAALGDPAARIMVVGGGRIYLKFEGQRADADHTAGEAIALGARFADAVLLGHAGGIPVIVAPTGADPAGLPAQVKAIDYRSVYVQELISRDRLGALAQGAALIAWHQSHRFCGRCGAATEIRAGGYRRRCPDCGVDHFPRTDPVVIMLAVSGDRCLLGRNPNFPSAFYSCLAGFLEPGETIEEAVRRETREEAGIRIGRVAYFASQPWPFPHTLMIGCHCEALTTELSIDEQELEDCRWFTRDEVRGVFSGTNPVLRFPPAGAIATHLIRAWAEAAD